MSFYCRYIKELGHDVDVFSASDKFSCYYNRSIFNKILFRLGLSSIYRRINKEFKDLICKSKVDAVVVFKGMELFPSSIDFVKNKNILISNYNPDHPFHFHGRGSGNGNMTNSIDKYDLHLTYNKQIKLRIDTEYKIPCEWIPFGFEPTNVTFPKENEEIKKACFIGFADSERASAIKYLVERNIPVDLYGPNWDKYFTTNDNVSVFPSVYNEEMTSVALKYRVQLNLFRPHNKGSHNMRSFEMPGIGCIMLAPDSVEHREFFEHGREVFLYNSLEELVSLVDIAFQLSYQEAIQIRKNAMKRCVESGYSYADRAALLVYSHKKYL